MQMLMSGRGLGTLGALAAGLIAAQARPGIAASAHVAGHRDRPDAAAARLCCTARKTALRSARCSAERHLSIVIVAVIDERDFTGRPLKFPARPASRAAMPRLTPCGFSTAMR